MFSGMMDPELMRIAQEQMSRMSPNELAKIQQQMMSNPDLMRMATESMQNMRPEDLKQAAEQLKHTRPEDMATIGEKMVNSSPDEIAAMRARMDAQMAYEINAAQMLKKQGNELHNQGRYSDALPKYLLAKKNLQGVPSSKGRTLLMACSLNLMSCYLKTRQFDECINEGSEVLQYDANNVKALYRRGQAFKDLGRLRDAVSDLSKAHAVSPEDETITDVLRDAKERLAKEGGDHPSRGVIIEEVTDDEAASTSEDNGSSVKEDSVIQPQETTNVRRTQMGCDSASLRNNVEALQALKDDPEAIRSFQNFLSNANPESLAAMGGGKVGDVPPEMLKSATNMISKLSPEELQNMVRMASSFQGENSRSGDVSDGNFNGFMPPNATPEMLKTATDMMGKMSPEELQKMFEMASSLGGQNSNPMSATLKNSGSSANVASTSSEGRESASRGRSEILSETSPASGLFSTPTTSQPSFPASSADLQEQMRNQMNNPAMREMFTSMMKNISPEMMANMSEQFGFKLSQEDAAKAQQAMSSFSPEHLEKMMRWVDRAQRGVQVAKRTKSWLLGKKGLILPICMLLLAMLLHRLGYIGS